MFWNDHVIEPERRVRGCFGYRENLSKLRQRTECNQLALSITRERHRDARQNKPSTDDRALRNSQPREKVDQRASSIERCLTTCRRKMRVRDTSLYLSRVAARQGRLD